MCVPAGSDEAGTVIETVDDPTVIVVMTFALSDAVNLTRLSP